MNIVEIIGSCINKLKELEKSSSDYENLFKYLEEVGLEKHEIEIAVAI